MLIANALSSPHGAAVLFGLSLTLCAAEVTAGSLDAPAAPTNAGSAMYTLTDLYNRLNAGTPGAPRPGAFAEPAAGPTAGTGYTLNQIMAAMPTLDNANGAVVADVVAGKTFWGLTGGAWGLRTGTAAAGANVTGTNGQLVIPIPNGLYSGGKTATAADTNLTAGNIKTGVTIFGTAGTFTSDGDAAASDLRLNKKAYVAGNLVTGTMPTQALSNANTTVSAGYYAATDLTTVDGDLATGNVRSTVTLFGVAGDPNVVNTSSGDATAVDLLTGKKAWVDGTEITGTYTAAPCTCSGTLSGTRWCDNGNGTVTDLLGSTVNGKLQGRCLVWLQNANCSMVVLAGILKISTLNWFDAVIWSSAVKNGDCGLSDGSVEGDWRLPTKTELQVLTTGTEQVRSGTPGPFTSIQPAYYWSSTTDAIGTSFARDVSLGNGSVAGGGKTMPNDYVWPVRGGP